MKRPRQYIAAGGSVKDYFAIYRMLVQFFARWRIPHAYARGFS